MSEPGLGMDVKGYLLTNNVKQPSAWIFGVSGTIRKLECVLCEPSMPVTKTKFAFDCMFFPLKEPYQF